MAQYDPQRSRSRHRSGDDEGPAPVDALLGPAETPPLIDLTDHPDEAAPDVAPATSPGLIDWELPPEPRTAGSLSPALLAAIVVAAVLLVWGLGRRRRRRTRDAD
jgi:hypothetical protein